MPELSGDREAAGPDAGRAPVGAEAPGSPAGTPAGGSGRAPALEIVGLGYNYPDGTPALHDVDLRVEAGESLAIIGPNGAGKSTLLLHLNGILRGRGTVRVFGVELSESSLREIRRRVGVVFQDPEDQLFLTSVAQDVAFGPSNLGLPKEEIELRVHEALAAVGMEALADRAAHHLSFGQKKRVATATVLSMHPDVLVLDEPSSNLDPRARRQLADILRGLDVTKVIVTHDLPYACAICTRAVVLCEGRVVADGPIAEIMHNDDLLAANGLDLPAGFNVDVMLREAAEALCSRRRARERGAGLRFKGHHDPHDEVSQEPGPAHQRDDHPDDADQGGV